MDFLITLLVLIIGFTGFAMLYAVANKFFTGRKIQQELNDMDTRESSALKVNKTHNIYEFKHLKEE